MPEIRCGVGRAALLLGMSALAASGAAAADNSKASAVSATEDAASLFGQREAIGAPALSPDGSKVLYLAADHSTGTAVMVAAADGSAAPVVAGFSSGQPMRIRRCDWADNMRILCEVRGADQSSGRLFTYERLISMAASGGDQRYLAQENASGRQLRGSQFDGYVLDWRQGTDGKVLLERDHVPEQTIGTNLAKTDDGLGVDLVDAHNNAAAMVERANKDAVEYIADGRGSVRMMATQPMTSGGYMKADLDWEYRRPGSRRWERFSTVREDGPGLAPLSVDAASDCAFSLAPKDGRKALFRTVLDGTMKTELVYADPKFDVDDVLSLGRQSRLIGARTTSEKGSTIYFDPEYRALAAALSHALSGLPQIDFVSASADESKLLLLAGSDTDPGRYYVFDKKTKHLNEIALVRPQLENMKLATMTAVAFRASDGTEIPAYLTLPPGGPSRNLPAIVMPHGGPASHDTWGFDWLVQYFAHQGFAVLQPEYRGSTGYGDGWLMKNGFKSWRTAVGDVVDAGRWLVTQGIASPGRLAIVGWSYGGYAALQSNVLAPDLFKAAVAVAPVTDIDALKRESIGFTNAALVADYLGNGAVVEEGSPARHAAVFKAPVLMFHGTADQNVSVEETRLMADHLRAAGKPVQDIIYPGLDHQLPSGEIRADMLRRADAFLRKSLGMTG